MIAGIELGGTKTVVAIGNEQADLIEQHRFPTTTPEETIQTASTWINNYGPVQGLGIASFGPVGINQSDPDTYGHILKTPKEHWSNFNLLGALQSSLPGTPIGLTTDVNAAAFAEFMEGLTQFRAGNGKLITDLVYITIGTGIGAGIIADGQTICGALHTEVGHLNVPTHPDDHAPSHCPYHTHCLEGRASGPAIAARWGKPAHELPPDHPAWDMEAWYLAQGIICLLATACPNQVIIGGGVSQAEGFHQKVESHLRQLANGYFPSLEANHPFVVPPHFQQDAGIRGALLLALAQTGPHSPPA